MDDVVIRSDLRSGDLGAIIGMHGEYYAEHHGFDATFEPYVALPLAEFALRRNPDEKIWVVERKTVLGSIAVTRADTETAQLRWFLLDPALQGQGLGKRLVHEAITFAQSRGYRRMSLWTVKGLDAAVALYKHQGFALAEEISHTIWGQTLSEQRYEREL